jgi:ketosteroid isomerase-like protein
MKPTRAFAMVFAFGVVLAAAATARAQDRPRSDFEIFLKSADAAQVELQNGKADSYKTLWSHSDDVTLSGGFGGGIEKGWAAVSKRLDWAASQFSNGTNSIERLVMYATMDIGYVVQIERIKFKAAATGEDASRISRVTMIFRRENGQWRIVHRQADSQTTKQPA